MALEIVSRGPDTEIDRKIAMLAEVLGCTVEDIVWASSQIFNPIGLDVIAGLTVKFLARVNLELARHTPERVSLP